MDENNTNQSSQENKSSTGMILGIVGAIVVVGLIGLWFVNRSSIDQLSRQVAETQNQVQNVNQEADESKEQVGEAMKEGLENVAGAIGDVNNPLIRLALAKAYISKIGATLDEQSKKDLDTVVIYVQKTPTVLVQKPAQLPAEVQTALTNLKAKLAAVKTSVAASMEAAAAKIGQGIPLTGTLAFVADDSVFGGSVFVLTTTDGKKYYFEFNQATSEQIKTSMLGKDVVINIKVTGIENGTVTYDVVSGPTLVVASPAASASAVVTP